MCKDFNFNGIMKGKTELTIFSDSFYINIPIWWIRKELFRKKSDIKPKKENFEVTFEATENRIIYVVTRIEPCGKGSKKKPPVKSLKGSKKGGSVEKEKEVLPSKLL